MSDEQLTVEVFSPTKLIFTGSALIVSSNNATGKFDILPQHANFVSLIKDYLIIRTNTDDSQQIDLDTGVLHCENNAVKVFVNIST